MGPIDEIRSLVQSPGYQAHKSRNPYGPSMLMTYMHRTDGLSSNDLASIKDEADQYIKTIEERQAQLKGFEGLLAGSPPEDQIREAALEYDGAMARYMPMEEDADTVRTSLLARIKNERRINDESLLLAKPLKDSVAHPQSRSIYKIKLKIHILNKGATDGLVRGNGEIQLSRQNLKLPLKVSSPAKEHGMPSGVMVRNIDGPTEPPRGSSVGKVEKHSLTEFWYEVDNDKAPKEDLTVLMKLIEEDDACEFIVLLKDHSNSIISAKIVQ